MSKPRILIFSVAYEPLVGGAELAVRNITDRLSTYEFDLITCRFSRSHKAQEKIGNVNVYRVGFGSRAGRYLYPAFAWRLARKLHLKNNYQVVWSIMAAYAGAAALLFLRRFPLPKFLLTLQEGDPIVHIHRRVRGLRQMWQRIFGRADYIQAISKYLADWAKAEGAECPVEVVPNGVAVEKFTPHPTLSPEGRGIKGEGSKIITTSRLVHKNGIDILVRAVEALKTLIPNSQFLIQILGSGPDENKLKRLAKQLGLEKEIQFFNHVEPQQIPKYLSRADIFVRPSRSEGLGSSFLEAMAAGLPIIATPVGGITDFLTPYHFSPPREGETERGLVNGLFVNPEDPRDLAEKIKLLIENDALRQKLGESGRKLVVEKYSWDRVAGQMDAIFKKLVA